MKFTSKKAPAGSALAALMVIGLAGCSAHMDTEKHQTATTDHLLQVVSPGDVLQAQFKIDDGKAYYRLTRGDREVMQWSKLGLTLAECKSFDEKLTIDAIARNTVDETWTQPWGEVKDIRNHYNQLSLSLDTHCDQAPSLNVTFRLYDDGLGFRYNIKGATENTSLNILSEQTEYAFTDDLDAWWTPAMEDIRYEYLYKKTPARKLKKAVHTPLTLESDKLFISIHEAALIDFPSMAVEPTDDGTLKSRLIPWADGVAAKGQGQLRSSWRTLQIAETPGDLITSYLILNLNDPSVMEDTSWIKPDKYGSIWWDFHINKVSRQTGSDFGATTERAKRYIDFYSQYDIPGFLVESWNLGWDGNWGENGDKMAFSQSHPAYDFEAIAKYAEDKGMYLIAHNETAANTQNYEGQLDEAYAFYAKNNVKALKTGYVGPKLDDKEWHHGQYGVRHYHKVMETAAKYKLMVNAHEPIKDTGLRRTYPNFLTREGARGQEFNAWGENGGNTVDHTTILPFTRMLSGPMDFTPGIFNFDYQDTRPGKRVPTTLAKQLALYVVLYSPQHNVTDLPENYEGHPAFKFIDDVPVDWADTRVLNGSIGDFVTIARKDRNSNDWYLGAITDGNSREMTLSLSFLDPEQTYRAEIYRDGKDANWESNPESYEIEVLENVTHTTSLPANLAAGGGIAVRFLPASG